LRARGDYTINAAWRNSALTEAQIFAGPNATGKLRLSYKGKAKNITVKPGESIKVTADALLGGNCGVPTLYEEKNRSPFERTIQKS
jgi:hypothetical protein